VGGTQINQDLGGGVEGIKVDKRYRSQMKGTSEEAPSCFRPDLNGHTCTSDSIWKSEL